MLPRSDAASDGVEPASCFVIQNCQTQFSLYGSYKNNVVCSLFTSATFVFRRRSKTPFVHGRIETPNASKQAIDFDLSCSGQTHFNRPYVDLKNVDKER